jgi:hypothetical protein
MTAIEMARECAGRCFDDRKIKPGAIYVMENAYAERCRKGGGDDYDVVQSALHMHTMRQTEIDAKDAALAELVQCLSECEGALAPLAKEPNVNPWLIDVRRLLAKHRADVFTNTTKGISHD